MILTSDKIGWYLFFCICSYKHQRKFKNSGFSAPDDMTIRQNLSRHNSMVVVFSASDDINIRQNSIIPVFRHLMILTSEKFPWCLFLLLNIIRCRKTGIIEFCLMLISSDAVKRDTMEISLMLISSDAANRCHWILSDVNVVRCRKAAINECHEMLTSSDAEKSCHEILTACTDTRQQLSTNILWC